MFQSRLHQISHWRRDNDQPKAVCIRLHYLSPQTLQLLMFTGKKFLCSYAKTKKTLSLFLQTAPGIEFPDQSHLNQCSQQEEFASERIAVFANILVIIVKYYLKELEKESLVSSFLVNALMCFFEQILWNSISHWFTSVRWMIATSISLKKNSHSTIERR